LTFSNFYSTLFIGLIVSSTFWITVTNVLHEKKPTNSRLHHFSLNFNPLNMENIFTASKPFLTVSKVFGFFPISVVFTSKKISVNSRWLDIFFTCFSSLILITLNVLTWRNSTHLAATDSSFLNSAWNLLRKVELAVYIFLFVYQISRREKIVSFLRKLHNFDEKVRNFCVHLRCPRFERVRVLDGLRYEQVKGVQK
jgi:7tm Chemosensory receptor